VVTVTVADGT
jgi:hypothetical protein